MSEDFFSENQEQGTTSSTVVPNTQGTSDSDDEVVFLREICPWLQSSRTSTN